MAATNKRMDSLEEMRKEIRTQFSNRDYRAHELYESIR